ncbi:hypothetical protein predicted by Glimmer/Critica [Sorangium cellulosum So ce56]|uniref:Cytochrome P450 n=1 Tax=Sorangium cellulosum (strain So ce56) TaxID=448385 RepID=A9EW44_SORC5|nr:hypothetical protein predicted by Glimmer/Critica [Sorangium cellulosum So ce56]
MKTDAFQSPAVKERRSGAFGLGHHLCPGRTPAYTRLGIPFTVLLRDFRIGAVLPLRRQGRSAAAAVSSA